MKLSTFKQYLGHVSLPVFDLRNGSSVPAHYHITEVWLVTKQFIDCGGVMRISEKVTFQLWYSTDRDHRLTSKKLLNIIWLYEDRIHIRDLDVQIEYQSDTIWLYDVDRINGAFVLVPTKTDCLAKEACWISQDKQPLTSDLMWWGSGCCGWWGCC